MKPPVFIIGSPRSGTTLLRLMITCHPRIVIPPEAGFAVWLRPTFSDWTGFDPDLTDRFIDAVFESRKFETWGVDRSEVGDFVKQGRPASYAQAVSLVYEWFARGRKPEFTRWGDKNNWYLEHVDDLAEMFPEANFIHIVRDGRDVACSYRRLHGKSIVSEYAPKLPSEIGDIAQQWSDNIEKIRRSFEKLDWRGVTEVRYEDLVRQPETTLSRVCEEIGEAYDAMMLDYPALNRDGRLEPQEFLQWKEKTLHAPSTSALEKHKTELSDDERAAFERIARAPLRTYDYVA